MSLFDFFLFSAGAALGWLALETPDWMLAAALLLALGMALLGMTP